MAHDFWKLRLFASSLTKMAFTWYSHLSPNSIGAWKDMEMKFHEEFYRAPPDVTLADLARISQLPRMNFAMREHFEGHRFRDLFELTNRVTSYERLLQEKEQRRVSSKGTYYRDQLDVAVITDSEDDSSDDEVCMAEFLGKKPAECAALRKPGYVKNNKVSVIQKDYSFDLKKADDIFDALLKDGQISLSEGHVIPSSKELAGKDYCNFYNSWRHSTNNCVVFQNVVQKAITEGKLLFPARKEADANYIAINTIRPNLDQVLGIRKVLEKWSATKPRQRVVMSNTVKKHQKTKLTKPEPIYKHCQHCQQRPQI
ncbi:uncharacterized protein LOC126681829 [Mercurialis annua]|uniref:uncharacterized protein LOC126681829 n=1 Tax=Mercurialis annua TaxID=3986 RepID=UPI00215F44B1|nr:uncharacterized protein LOC126681829 [Mercurialis annua]